MNDPLSSRVPFQVQAVVMRYLSERLDAAAISTAGAVKLVRQQVPNCGLTDEQITKLVAEKAIEAGFGVSFEGAAVH